MAISVEGGAAAQAMGLDMTVSASLSGVMFKNIDNPDIPEVYGLYFVETTSSISNNTGVNISVSVELGGATAEIPESYNENLTLVAESWTENFLNQNYTVTVPIGIPSVEWGASITSYSSSPGSDIMWNGVSGGVTASASASLIYNPLGYTASTTYYTLLKSSED